MRAHRTFICFFFLTLQDRLTGLINAENLDRTGTEGGNVTVGCSFNFSGKKRIFYDCEEKDILVETEKDRAQNGRYSIEYKKTSFFAWPILYVSITNLTKSDSGQYRCALNRDWLPDGYYEFYITVTDAPTSSKPNWTLRPFSTSVPSASTLKTTQSLSSTSGRSKPSSASPETTEQSQQQQTPAARPGVQLYVRPILMVLIIVLSAAVLIFTLKRKPKEAPVETEYVNVTEATEC